MRNGIGQEWLDLKSIESEKIDNVCVDVEEVARFNELK